MHKISLKQYLEYRRVTDAVNTFSHLINDLQAYSQFLQRVGDFVKLDELNELLSQFVSSARVSYQDNLEDDVEE